MCGILGIITTSNSAALDPHKFDKALNTLSHRGPDYLGKWISNCKTVQFGHARLSIVDPLTGNQPIHRKNQALTIISNGEFYHHKEIRNQLKNEGYQFSTQSDAEVALCLYEKYGLDALKQLNGEFAFLIWDNNLKKLIAVRDRFGIKPLYYTIYQNNVIFSSEVKAFFAAGVPASFDEESLLYQMSCGALLADRTLFKGIQQIPPGHVMQFDGTNIKLQQYWDFDFPQANISNQTASYDEITSQLSTELQKAVQTRIDDLDKFACYLSGGIDSNTVFFLANQQRKMNQKMAAFSVSFENEDLNEALQAAKSAKTAGVEHHIINISQQDLADHFKSAIYHSEALVTNAHNVGKFLLSRKVRMEGFKVTLTGEGADEMLAGYEHFQEFANNPNALTNCFSVGWFKTAAIMGQVLSNILTPTLREQFTQNSFATELMHNLDLKNKIAKWDPLHQATYLWSKTFFPNYILSALGDRAEMANGIEGRLPFLDNRVVDFLSSLPATLLLQGQLSKQILRDSVKNLVPAHILNSVKRPFMAPSLTEGTPLWELFNDTLRSSNEISFIEKPRVIAMVEQLTKLQGNQRMLLEKALMLIFSFYMLQDVFCL